MVAGRWVMLRQHCGTAISDQPMGDQDGRQPHARRELRMQRLGDAGRTGARVMRRRLPVIRADCCDAWRADRRWVGMGGSVTITELDQGREEQEDLCENRHAGKRVPNCGRQVAPADITHGR